MATTAQQTRILARDVVLMVVAGFVPALVLGLAGWSSGANVAIFAGLSAFIACMGGRGWRTGLAMSAPFAVFAGLVTWSGSDPWLAALLLAIVAFLRGIASRSGMHDALVMAVIALAYFAASPPTSDTSLPAPLFVMLVSLGAALWATLVILVLRHRLALHQLRPVDPIQVLPYSLALALLVGTATWFVVDLGLGHTGGWIILTILVVFQPALGSGFTKAAHRAAGTVLGFAIALLVGAVVPPGAVLYVVGLAFLMVAFLFILQGRTYWLYAAVLTPAIVLLESAGSTVALVAEERLGATLVGVAVTLALMLALSPLAHRLAVRSADAIPPTGEPPG